MATLRQLSENYFIRIKNSDNPVNEFEKIINEINKLIYSETNIPISDNDKATIVSYIVEGFESERKTVPFGRLFEQEDLIKCFSNDRFLELIEYIRARTKR